MYVARRRHRMDEVQRKGRVVRYQPRVWVLRRRPRHQLEDQPQRHGQFPEELDLHERRTHSGRRLLLGGNGGRGRQGMCCYLTI